MGRSMDISWDVADRGEEIRYSEIVLRRISVESLPSGPAHSQ